MTRAVRDVLSALPSNRHAAALLVVAAFAWGVAAYLLNVAPTAP